jgi:hypothetical protein
MAGNETPEVGPASLADLVEAADRRGWQHAVALSEEVLRLATGVRQAPAHERCMGRSR